jgi:hypothetical protein
LFKNKQISIEKNIIMTLEEFNNLSLAEKGLAIVTDGKHLTQLKKEDLLFNLYTLNDFFIEIVYSIPTNEITSIEALTDLGKIDQYIDGNNQKKSENKTRGTRVSLN